MENIYNYTCPNCSKDCSVSPELAGHNVTCPNCSSEFFAHLGLPEHLPFFRHGRRRILEEKFDQLITSGSIDQTAERELIYLASSLKLDESEWQNIRKERFLDAFQPIKLRMESTMMMTDEDMEAIQQLEKKYGAHPNLVGEAELLRAIYLIETKSQLPSPISTDLMLGGKEAAYFSIATIWHQTRIHTHGYSGASVSLPTGINGVRFRFGGYTPTRSEEITPLSTGILYITSKRLLFNGDSRNTSVNLSKIVDCHLFLDSLKIDKSTGKPDFFSMKLVQGRYILALVGLLK